MHLNVSGGKYRRIRPLTLMNVTEKANFNFLLTDYKRPALFGKTADAQSRMKLGRAIFYSLTMRTTLLLLSIIIFTK